MSELDPKKVDLKELRDILNPILDFIDREGELDDPVGLYKWLQDRKSSHLAEIERLSKEVERLKAGAMVSDKLVFEFAKKLGLNLESINYKISVDGQEVRKALEFYADKKSWEDYARAALTDNGERARKALGKI